MSMECWWSVSLFSRSSYFSEPSASVTDTSSTLWWRRCCSTSSNHIAPRFLRGTPTYSTHTFFLETTVFNISLQTTRKSIQIAMMMAKQILCQIKKWGMEKWTLSHSTGEVTHVELCHRAVCSTHHLFPDLGDLLQTRCQLLVLWYHRLTCSLCDRGSVVLALVRICSCECNIISQVDVGPILQ